MLQKELSMNPELFTSWSALKDTPGWAFQTLLRHQETLKRRKKPCSWMWCGQEFVLLGTVYNPALIRVNPAPRASFACHSMNGHAEVPSALGKQPLDWPCSAPRPQGSWNVERGKGVTLMDLSVYWGTSGLLLTTDYCYRLSSPLGMERQLGLAQRAWSLEF